MHEGKNAIIEIPAERRCACNQGSMHWIRKVRCVDMEEESQEKASAHLLLGKRGVHERKAKGHES
eukprot:1136506-Pelagomonas_calceolata.AAC.4